MPSPGHRAPPVDLPGQLLMIAALGSLTFAVIQGPVAGWTAARCHPVCVAGARRGRVLLGGTPECGRGTDPLLELRFFRSRPFTGASVIAVASFVVLGGFLFVITLYLQQARGFSPLRAGLSLLPATLVMAATGPVAGQLTGRRGPRIPLVAAGL